VISLTRWLGVQRHRVGYGYRQDLKHPLCLTLSSGSLTSGGTASLVGVVTPAGTAYSTSGGTAGLVLSVTSGHIGTPHPHAFAYGQKFGFALGQ